MIRGLNVNIIAAHKPTDLLNKVLPNSKIETIHKILNIWLER